jgi:hypothetical protein
LRILTLRILQRELNGYVRRHTFALDCFRMLHQIKEWLKAIQSVRNEDLQKRSLCVLRDFSDKMGFACISFSEGLSTSE